MRRARALAAVLWLGVHGPALAEERTEEGPILQEGGPPAEAPAIDMNKMQEEMEKVQEQLQQQRQEQLEQLKDLDPNAYESQKKAEERQAQMNQILSAYQQQEITAEAAQRRLTPLIRQEVQAELASLDEQIRMTEKKLAALKQAKSNPNALVRKRLDQVLGRGGPPSPDDLF